MDLHLKGHTALIVGGASGIGLATAGAFAAEGAHVAIWDRADTVSEVADALATESQVRTVGVTVDITDEAAVRTALRTTINRVGTIHHVVHAAAIGSGKFGFPFTNLSPADWPRVLKVNVLGMVN